MERPPVSRASEYAKRVPPPPPGFFHYGWDEPLAWVTSRGEISFRHDLGKWTPLPPEEALRFARWLKETFE